MYKVDKDGLRGGVEEYWAVMQAQQERDPELSGWVEKLKKGGTMKKDRGELVLDGGVLFKIETDERHGLVLPMAQREEIMRSVHENQRTGGHFSAKKAMMKVRKRWWWPGVYTDMEQWVASCRVCQQYQHVRGMPKTKGRQPRVVPNRPWDAVFIDAVGPLPSSGNGMRYILVAVDHFTRFAMVRAVRRLTKETFVEWLREDLVGRWGPMTRLTSDRGSNFMADVSKAMCDLWGIDKHATTAWRPEANGLVERFNGTLKAMLKEYSEEQGSSWHKGIHDYLFAYNTSACHDGIHAVPSDAWMGGAGTL